MRRRAGRKPFAVVLLILVAAVQCAAARDVDLVKKGKVRCVIVAPPGSMAWEGDDKALGRWPRHSEMGESLRRLQRDSIRDLAHYLGKMCGATIDVVEAQAARDRRLPIYIGGAAQKVFGPVGISKAGKFGFRVVAGSKGVGLYGESKYGTSYAIYELLHRLGCRWYMPSELGECVPSLSTITLPQTDVSLAPATEWRRMENRTADADFRRRNRMNGNMVKANHALEGYITKEQREAHPEWRLVIDGKPHPKYLRWTRQDVADAIADSIIARLDKEFTPTVSLSPGDYVVPADDPEERKHDPDPRVWEPAANKWSVTDRLILLANRVAERVGKKYPDVLFGLLAYVNYNMPPARYDIHPNVIPMIAPIDFNRHHPMTWKDHPNETWLLDIVKGWGAKAPRLAYYAYGMNLAELSAPNPFITKWGTDIPIIMKSNCAFWAPETMGGWESMMPGFYLSTRLTFYPDEKPAAILDEMMVRFYGAAAEPMKQYWHHIDRSWVEANEFAGCGYGYLQMFTPEVMAKARTQVDEALSKCQTITEYQRVNLVDESLSLFELFMKMRRDWASGDPRRLRSLAGDLDTWRGWVRYLRRRYKEQYVMGGLAESYVNWFFGKPYAEASRMAKDYAPLGRAMVNWRFRHDAEKQAEELGWTKPDFDDAEWKTTHVVEETWSALGHHNTMGRMVYRTTAGLRAVAKGKKAWLWIGSTDGSAKLFVNGKHVPYVVPEKTRRNEKGDVLDAFSGYCKPASFDVTSAITKGKNQITIICERKWLNELGTGGLMGPVLLYREK